MTWTLTEQRYVCIKACGTEGLASLILACGRGALHWMPLPW